MYKYISENLPGVQFMDSDHNMCCACACMDVGDNYSLFVVADYVPAKEANGMTAAGIVRRFTDGASPQLFEQIFSDDADSGTEYFLPVFDYISEKIAGESGSDRHKNPAVSCMVVEKSTLKARFAGRGKTHTIIFDRFAREYETAWPRFQGVTSMWGFIQLHPGCNILLANDTMFHLLYNNRTRRLYKIYEEMMFSELDQPFNLKALGDIAYIAADLNLWDSVQ